MSVQVPRRMRLPLPDPYAGADRCVPCAGTGVTGRRYTAPAGAANDGTVVVVDELCRWCRGCGRSSHDGCGPAVHGDWEGPEDPPEGACPFCYGRTWFAVLGFGQSTAEARRVSGVSYLRMPCDCAAALMVEA